MSQGRPRFVDINKRLSIVSAFLLWRRAVRVVTQRRCPQDMTSPIASRMQYQSDASPQSAPAAKGVLELCDVLMNFETSSRVHIESTRTAELHMLKQSQLGGAAAIGSMMEHELRRRVSDEEALERFRIVDNSRISLWTAMIRQEETFEQQVRRTYITRRDIHVVSLIKKRALLACVILSSSSPQCEGGERSKTLEAEEAEFAAIYQSYLACHFGCCFKSLVLEEAKARSGHRGVCQEEAIERCKVVRLLYGLKILLFQGDDIGDISTECGSRAAIEGAQRIAWRKLQAEYSAGTVHLVLPLEERAARLQVLREEYQARMTMLSAPMKLEREEFHHEPRARLAIFREWCRVLAAMMFILAFLKITSKEERRRFYFEMIESIELRCLASLEYIEYSERADRELMMECFYRGKRQMRQYSSLGQSSTPRLRFP